MQKASSPDNTLSKAVHTKDGPWQVESNFVYSLYFQASVFNIACAYIIPAFNCIRSV